MHGALFGVLKETENGCCLVWEPEKNLKKDVVCFGDLKLTENVWHLLWRPKTNCKRIVPCLGT